MASTINASNSGFGGIVSTGDSSGQLQLQTANTTALTIDTSQNVGIGTTSPDTKLTVTGADGATLQRLKAATGVLRTRPYVDATNGAVIDSANLAESVYLPFTMNGSSVRLGDNTGIVQTVTGGNVGIGTTNPTYKLDISSGNSNTLNITTNNTNTTIFNITRTSVTTVTHTLDNTGYKIINGGSGGLYLGYTGTSWTSLSDERFKTDLKPIQNAVEKVSTLRAVTGRFKTDDEDKSRAFLIAQDIQAVLPEAVDTSNPEQLGVSYTDTIPLLVAAIKEQQTIINDLKARIETLESK